MGRRGDGHTDNCVKREDGRRRSKCGTGKNRTETRRWKELERFRQRAPLGTQRGLLSGVQPWSDRCLNNMSVHCVGGCLPPPKQWHTGPPHRTLQVSDLLSHSPTPTPHSLRQHGNQLCSCTIWQHLWSKRHCATPTQLVGGADQFLRALRRDARTLQSYQAPPTSRNSPGCSAKEQKNPHAQDSWSCFSETMCWMPHRRSQHTRQPESPNVDISGPQSSKTPPKFHGEDTQEKEEIMEIVAGRVKKIEFWASGGGCRRG